MHPSARLAFFFAFSEIDLKASGVLERLSARQRDRLAERTFQPRPGCAGLQSDGVRSPDHCETKATLRSARPQASMLFNPHSDSGGLA
jgi:hypothetical protein